MLDPRTIGLRGVLNALNRRRIHLGPATLADRIFAPALLMDIVLVLCGAVIVAMAAQFVVPLWPVPSTGQIIGVLCVGYSLGSVRGGLAVLLYVAMGAAGLPVFNQGASGWEHLAGATGGYLVGFVVAAVLAGLCAARGLDRRFVSNLICSFAITQLVYVFGVVRLMMVNDYDLNSAIAEGFTPLFLAGVMKVLVVAVAIAGAWHFDGILIRRAADSPARPRTHTLRG